MTTENKLWQFINELLKMIIGFGKAQLIMFGINFLIITVGMGIIGLGWWSLLIGIGIACLDLLPVIGAGIVFLPWTILALISGNTAMALGVAIIYIAMVIIRMVLDPVITGHHIGLSPWITLASSILGLILCGGIGVIIGPAIAALANIFYRINRNNINKNTGSDKENMNMLSMHK